MKQGLHITPQILAAAYEFLRALPPFNRWKLPPASELQFKVTSSKDTEGYYDDKRGKNDKPGQKPTIGISQVFVGHSHSLLETMAHEMTHVYLFRKKVRKYHGPEFQRCAERVCKYHGFDPKRFI